MKRTLSVCLVILALLLAVDMTDGFAQVMSNVSLTTGPRVDRFYWNIAGDSTGNNPNVLSELTWKDIRSYGVRASGVGALTESLYVRSSVGYGSIYHGSTTDSDYNGDDRTLLFAKSESKTQKGYLLDTSAGIGIALNPWDYLWVAPVIGASYNKQKFRITDGVTTFPAVTPLSGLNSTYSAQWYGPWAGIDLSYAFKDISVTSSLEYHVAYFKAEADWNLRSNLAHPKSFEQKNSNSGGMVANLGINYALNKQWSLSGTADYEMWRAYRGVDTTYFADGTSGSTRLNIVKWDSLNLGLGVKYNF